MISFQSISPSPRKLCATSDQASSEVSRWRQRARRAGQWCSCPRLRRLRVRARLLLEPPRDEEADPGPHERDQDEAAEELRERELPAEEDPHHDPDLEHEVRRGELERHRASRGSRPSGTSTSRSRSPRSCTTTRRRRGRSRARPCAGRGRRARARCASARHPRLDDPGEREAEHERPPDLPRHLERVPEAVADPLEHVHAPSLVGAVAAAVRPGLEPVSAELH